MSSSMDRYQRLHAREAGGAMDRVVFFSDAVFAIAMTLLVIDLRIPAEQAVTTHRIAETVPSIVGYAISFAVIALNWLAHHRKFRAIVAVDGRLIALNLVLLFFIALIPFPTSLLSGAGTTPPLAVVLYATVVGAAGLMQLIMWIYARRNDLLEPEAADPAVFRHVLANLAVSPVVFALSVPVALLVGAHAGMYTWLLMLPGNLIAGRWDGGAKRRERAVSRSRD